MNPIVLEVRGIFGDISDKGLLLLLVSSREGDGDFILSKAMVFIWYETGMKQNARELYEWKVHRSK